MVCSCGRRKKQKSGPERRGRCPPQKAQRGFEGTRGTQSGLSTKPRRQKGERTSAHPGHEKEPGDSEVADGPAENEDPGKAHEDLGQSKSEEVEEAPHAGVRENRKPNES